MDPLTYDEMREAMEISIAKGYTCDRKYEGWQNITLKSGKIVSVKMGYPDSVMIGPEVPA